MTAHNLILNVDSYKASHYLQYPPGSEYVSSYIECRGGEFPEAVFFGLQAFIKQYLLKPISAADIDEAEQLLHAHGLPCHRAGWEHILQAHAGLLPLEISAVPEGTVVPLHNVMLQVVNTCPACFWLTTYIETALLRAIWYPATVATQSREIKKVIAKYLEETAGSLKSLPFKLHDFGARGASSLETAMLGGMAHLVNFQGTDTVSGVIAAHKYYGADMAGFSIPAAEHSTITAWGRPGEAAAYANMLDHFAGPDRVVAVVSDSYDIWSAIDTIWGGELRERVIQNGGTLVIRPDSGEPVKMVTESLERLMRIFGARTNRKGYRVLPDFIRIIQGDGISRHSIPKILQAMKTRKQSAENITFGMGGELLQKLHRDTMNFAMKANAIRINGHWHGICKNPRTGPEKKSRCGRLALVRNNAGQMVTIALDELGQRKNLLEPVYRDGQLLRETRFEEVRHRAQIPLRGG
ncbi:nicotinate phosphoribosyltransferase [Microbulbifer thermotolerans]|uniref:Nicotinamide phosphoribosyltransferase n=1 Tax=Microbulbifer thermotolerans TaxID=252514 RepID=A0A143HHT5_MICTH|nr:nicotinate phosphoribosyltransferase [Microbulbifer thermotolerans]AMX01279.1 nicotinate phosphoribosyltransferase [Microbulbifer thermotolerans]